LDILLEEALACPFLKYQEERKAASEKNLSIGSLLEKNRRRDFGFLSSNLKNPLRKKILIHSGRLKPKAKDSYNHKSTFFSPSFFAETRFAFSSHLPRPSLLCPTLFILEPAKHPTKLR